MAAVELRHAGQPDELHLQDLLAPLAFEADGIAVLEPNDVSVAAPIVVLHDAVLAIVFCRLRQASDSYKLPVGNHVARRA